jgi:hypothetical protein
VRVTVANPGVIAATKLLYWDNTTKEWLDASLSCNPPYSVITGNELEVHICHLTQFATFENYHINHPDFDYDSYGFSTPESTYGGFEMVAFPSNNLTGSTTTLSSPVYGKSREL